MTSRYYTQPLWHFFTKGLIRVIMYLGVSIMLIIPTNGLATDTYAEREAKLQGTRILAQTPTTPTTTQKHGARGVTCATCHETATPTEPPATEKCASCHNVYGQKSTHAAGTPDPHHSHVGELACGKCHREHQPSVMFCNKCHVFRMKVP